MGIEGIPVHNVENACASGSFAFHLAWAAVATGMHDCVLVVGFEKLYDKDKAKSYLALESGIDVEEYRTYFQRVEAGLDSAELSLQSMARNEVDCSMSMPFMPDG